MMKLYSTGCSGEMEKNRAVVYTQIVAEENSAVIYNEVGVNKSKLM
jgi:hypothetical protein